jgi:hypothetical protein
VRLIGTMALEEYRRKRDLTKTVEPGPENTPSLAGHSYLIQKHDATRLHYDLRLGLDGVLLSWASRKVPASIPPVSVWRLTRRTIRCRTGPSRARFPKANMGAAR